MKKFILVSVLVFLTTALALAQTQTPRSNKRQKAQRARIIDGRQSGEITNKERAVLNGQQRRIRKTERVAKADGIVSPSEKARIERKQDRASRTIRRSKNNNAPN
jgi:septal ring-binding cell division protein DamX